MPGLNELMKTAEKNFGKGRLSVGIKDLRSQKKLVDFPRLPIGIFPLDFGWAGGIPFNTPVQLFGPYEGGKSTLAIMLMKYAAKFCFNPDCLKPRVLCKCRLQKKAKSMLVHTEGLPPDPRWFQRLRYDYEKELVVALPDYGEMACDMIEAGLKADDCGLVIIDSLAGIVPRIEMTAGYLDWQIAYQSRLIAKLFHRTSAILVNEWRRNHMVALVYINQIRAIIGGSAHGPTENTPGGFAAKHGYRLSARVSQLAGDVNVGDVDKDSSTKNVMRCACSLLGSQAKQQLLVLAGRMEYKITIREAGGYNPGTPVDVGFWVQKAKELGLLETSSLYKGYKLKDSKVFFDKLTDIEEVFKKGEYKGVKGFDDALRFMLVEAARKIALRKLSHDPDVSIMKCAPPAADVPIPKIPEEAELEADLESEPELIEAVIPPTELPEEDLLEECQGQPVEEEKDGD